MSSHEEISFQILRALRRILKRTSQYSRAVTRESGLSVPQMLCLKTIDDLSDQVEITVAMIAEAVQLTPATVSRILDRLEELKLVIRERRSKDRRKVCLSLTESGRAQLLDLPEPLNEEFVQRVQGLDTAERQQLLSSLERIVELMDAESLDAAPLLALEDELNLP